MPTTITCPACGKTGRLPDGYAKSTAACPRCQNQFELCGTAHPEPQHPDPPLSIQFDPADTKIPAPPITREKSNVLKALKVLFRSRFLWLAAGIMMGFLLSLLTPDRKLPPTIEGLEIARKARKEAVEK